MKNQSRLYSSIKQEELTPDMQLLAEVCGMDKLRLILEELRGMTFYIPRITRIEKFVDRWLAENKRLPPKELARELGVSENYIRRFTARRFKEKQAARLR